MPDQISVQINTSATLFCMRIKNAVNFLISDCFDPVSTVSQPGEGLRRPGQVNCCDCTAMYSSFRWGL